VNGTLPGVTEVRALAVHALPGVTEVRALAVHALPGVPEVGKLARIDEQAVARDPGAGAGTPSTSDPRALPPQPPPGDLGIKEVGIALDLCYPFAARGYEPCMAGNEINFVNGRVGPPCDIVRSGADSSPQVRDVGVGVIHGLDAMRVVRGPL